MTLAAVDKGATELNDNDLTRFQTDLLAALQSLGATKGTRIMQCLQDRYGNAVHHGHLYPTLDELHEQELIAKTDGDDERSNCYELTPAGVDVLAERHEWLAGDGRWSTRRSASATSSPTAPRTRRAT